MHGILFRVYIFVTEDADAAYVTLQIWKYVILQQFSEISDFKTRDFNKISKRVVRDFKGVADPSCHPNSKPLLVCHTQVAQLASGTGQVHN